MVQAHAYWNLKGLKVDLVIWNEDHTGYRQVLQDEIQGLIAAGLIPLRVTGRRICKAYRSNIAGGQDTAANCARIIISDDKSSLIDQS